MGSQHFLDFVSISGVNLIGRMLAGHPIVTDPPRDPILAPCRLTLLIDEEGLATITELLNVGLPFGAL